MPPSLGDLLAAPERGNEIVAGGRLDKAMGTGVYDRDLGAYAIVYVIAGGGRFGDQRNAERPVAAGDLLYCFPGLRPSYHNPDRRWTECWLAFRGPLFRELESTGLLDRAQAVRHPGLDPELIRAFSELLDDVRRGPWHDPSILLARLHLLLAEAANASRRRHPDSAGLGIGYERFRKTFAAAVGMAPARYRLRRRIARARELLVEGDRRIADIAEELGFCDPYHFTRQFGKLTGLSPARYRRQLRGS